MVSVDGRERDVVLGLPLQGKRTQKLIRWWKTWIRQDKAGDTGIVGRGRMNQRQMGIVHTDVTESRPGQD